MRTTTFTLLATAALLVAGVLAAPVAAAAPITGPAPKDTVSAGAYTAVGPNRILDTRDGTGVAGGTRSPLTTGAVRMFTVAGRGGVPSSGASSVVLNVTVTNPTSTGYLTVFPAGGTPTTSNLNFIAGQTVANLVSVQLPASGTVSLVYGGGRGTVDVVADVDGWFADGGTPTADGAFTPLAPQRLLDTRTNGATIGATNTTSLRVSGVANGSATAGAVVVNVTVTNTSSPGYLTVFPTGDRPTASNLNFVAGQTVPNLVVVPVAQNGSISLYNGSSTPSDVVVDVFGYFNGSAPSQTGMFGALSPARVLDTRSGTGVGTAAPVRTGVTLPLTVLGRGGVPTADVSAVVLNVTAVTPTTAGYLTVYGDGTRPLASNLNFPAGAIVPNLVIAPVSSAGTVNIYNGAAGTVDLVADVTGFVRDGTLTVPDASVSRYVNDLKATQTNAQIAAAMQADGKADAAMTSGTDARLSILEFGAQSARAGGDGTGSGNQTGVSLPAVPDPGMRLTYAQVQVAFRAYLDGYVAGRPASATGPVTVALGTNSAGFLGATYTPSAKGADWAAQVKAAASYATSQGYDLTVVGADDIEADFSATAAELRTWIGAYRGVASPPALINNGAASNCPSTLGVVNTVCGAVYVEESDPDHPVYNTFSQADYVSFSTGTGITIAPQVYFPVQAAQWENILLSTGGSAIRFSGVLTQAKACDQVGDSSCGDLTPTEGWSAMHQALAGNAATAALVIPTVTDIRYP